MSGNQEQLTMIPGLETGFLFAEDYTLFGILVLHGLCRPRDLEFLAEAQRQDESRPTLLALLATHNNLSDKSRADVGQLLAVLREPKLRALLPQELPAVQTIVNRMETTRFELNPAKAPRIPQPADHAAETVVDPNAGATAPGTHLSKTQVSVMGSATQLSLDEVQRIERSKGKSKLIGQSISGHVLLDRLGSGGQGDVYLAKQLSLNRYVALKKLEIPGYASPEQFIDSFRREAQTLAGINHARIVKVFEIFSENDMVFFTMEHLNGKTLRDIVKSNGAMPPEVVANLACQACSALGRTAEANIIHRDIKPANMILDENGDLKILDFGLAGAVEQFKGEGGMFAGTPQFAAPEQCEQKPLSPATDQYSLGVTLYYALTGELPFKQHKVQDLLAAHVHETPRTPSHLNPALSRNVDRALLKMLAKDPAQRFATFDECYEAWEAIANESQETRAIGSKQLLGESLLRFGREQKQALLRNSIVVLAVWALISLGALFGEFSLRNAGMAGVLAFCGDWGTYILAFSLSCIFYVAAARRGFLPLVGSFRGWLYTHIATAIPSVMMILIHSGYYLFGILPGGTPAKPVLSIVMTAALTITGLSGAVGLVIFRALRRQLQLNELELRGGKTSPREQMVLLLGARMLSNWRLVHYPLAIFVILMIILHIAETVRFGMP